MQESVQELFQNLKEEGYVDVYFFPAEEGSSISFRENGIRYNPNDDWEWFCRNQLKLDIESVLLINEEDKFFIKGNKEGSASNEETITYQITFK